MDRSFSFDYPLNWEVEELGGNGLEGVLLIAAEAEANWQANMYFETGFDPEGRDLRQALADLASNLPASKPGFRLVQIDSISTASSEAGRIVYTHVDAGTSLYSWELIVSAESGTSRLFVTAATAEVLKRKYLPIFEAVAGSLNFER